MKKFIAITGKIASGKSKAVELLKKRDTNHFNFKFIDLDEFCKTIKSSTSELESFFDNWLGTVNPTVDIIIRDIFSNETLYEEYCRIFNKHIKNYLDSLDDGIYIIEASAIFSYPEIFNMMHHIVVIETSDEIRKRNLNLREIRNTQIFDEIFDNGIKKLQDNRVSKINLTNGSLLELRAMLELKIIDIIYTYDYYDDDYLDYWYDQISSDFSKKFFEEHSDNPYHNKFHTISVLTDLVFSSNYTVLNGYVALYHDYVYTPLDTMNEKKSADVVPFFDGHNAVREMICKTDYKTIESENDELFNFFLSDISHWSRTPEEIIEAEQLVFKEYQMVDFDTYKVERLKILNRFASMKRMPENYVKGIELSIGWLKSFQPKIGWFCGSFNPFTIGHFDILKKAEKMFDKVVIVQGINPDKSNKNKSLKEIHKTLAKYEIHENIRNIPELLNHCKYTPTLIRGIRNNNDVLDAQNWLNCIKEFSNVEGILIFGEQKNSHISSSFVRNAEMMGFSIDKFIVK